MPPPIQPTAQTLKLEDVTQKLRLDGTFLPVLTVLDQQITGLMVAIRGVVGVQLVRCDVLDPPLPPLVTELRIELIDGRRARYRFAVVTPPVQASYTLSIDSGLWTESETLSIIPVRRAILALHELGEVSSVLWEIKP